MRHPRSTPLRLAASTPAAAANVEVEVTVHNLAPTNGISFAPLRLGFNNGSFDAFHIGQVATAPIISVAEGGSGAAWLPAFMAADPTATIGSGAGLLTPGATLSASFMVDTALNKFFTFGFMVVPSNDFFNGNDSPTEYKLFDNAGHLLINQIGVRKAGPESADGRSPESAERAAPVLRPALAPRPGTRPASGFCRSPPRPPRPAPTSHPRRTPGRRRAEAARVPRRVRPCAWQCPRCCGGRP